jgi:hypothetical protein
MVLWLEAQVAIDRENLPAPLGDILRNWFSTAIDAFSPPMSKQLWADEPLGRESLKAGTNGTPYGRPFSVWANTSVERRIAPGKHRSRRRPVNEKDWSRFLESLDDTTVEADLMMFRLNDEGHPPGNNNLIVRAEENEEDPRWIFLTAQFPEDWMTDPSYRDGLLAAVRSFAGSVNPSFGQIGRHRSILSTDLESVLGEIPHLTVRESWSLLRGYAWVTICPEPLGSKLGGLNYLAKSGVFHDTVRLQSGGYWLQSTEDFFDYGLVEAERLFRVLAPVLRHGMPRPYEDSPPYLVARQDAADFHA